MIETCKDYITCRGSESIWSQDREQVKEKLTQCIVLNKVYRKTYIAVKNQPFVAGEQPFNFSENYVFGKFDAFCRRLSKIISMFDLIDDYNNLFKKRMEGLLLGDGKWRFFYNELRYDTSYFFFCLSSWGGHPQI